MEKEDYLHVNHCDVLQGRSSTIPGADSQGVKRPGVPTEMFCCVDVARLAVDRKAWPSRLICSITEEFCLSEAER